MSKRKNIKGIMALILCICLCVNFTVPTFASSLTADSGTQEVLQRSLLNDVQSVEDTATVRAISNYLLARQT